MPLNLTAEAMACRFLRRPSQALRALCAATALVLVLLTSSWSWPELELPSLPPSASTDAKDIAVVLWTRGNPDAFHTLEAVSTEALAKTYFNPSHPTKILVHGFADKASTLWTRRVRDAYLAEADYNVFSVDWSKLALFPWYTTAAKNIRLVGQSIFSLISALSSAGVPTSELHVIGFSLGAHAAAVAGAATNGSLGRITGLDPSAPLFRTASAADRLDISDAVFVDAIHTAGRWVGLSAAVGHADFYPNGGSAPQPGCNAHSDSYDLKCSHFRAWELFAESIASPLSFPSVACPDLLNCCLITHSPSSNVVLMGEAAAVSTRGVFYLVTNEQKPFGTENACALGGSAGQ